MILLCAKGCVGDLVLRQPGQLQRAVRPTYPDLAVISSQWVKLKVEAKNKQMRFFVNGEKAYYAYFFCENPLI